MPEHLKSAKNSKEFQSYLSNFIKTKERQHRQKVVKQFFASIFLMMAG
jgi:hypothetical protein